MIIQLDKWIPDELHIMLQIWDQLWSLVLAELKEFDQFDNICHDEIVQEMEIQSGKRVSIPTLWRSLTYCGITRKKVSILYFEWQR